MSGKQPETRRSSSRLCTGILLSLSIGMFAAFAFLAFQCPEAFTQICREDGIIENIQAIVFFLGAVSATHLVFRFHRNRDFINAGVFSALCLFLFLVAMEEISWGQRAFGVKTPAKLRKVNIQKEVNLHNVGNVQKLIFPAYALLGAGALVSASLRLHPRLRNMRKLRHMVLHPGLIPFFLPSLIYGLYRMRIGDWLTLNLKFPRPTAKLISLIQEPVELGLGLGFLLFVLVTWISESLDEQQRHQVDGFDNCSSPLSDCPASRQVNADR